MPGLGREVLDDDLLDVAPPAVRLGDGLKRLDAVAPVLADAHQDSRGVGDLKLPGRLQSGQPALRGLVGGAPVGVEVGPQRLDHHSLAGSDPAQRRELVRGHGPGVGVGQQARGVQHEARHGGHIVDSALIAVTVEPVAGHRVSQLGALAQSEQRFVASVAGPDPGDVEHLVRGQVGGFEPGRRLRERAVSAAVPAQLGQRYEDLGRVRDPRAVVLVADGAGPFRYLG